MVAVQRGDGRGGMSPSGCCGQHSHNCGFIVSRRDRPDLLAPEARRGPQEPMALKAPPVALETLVLWERRYENTHFTHLFNITSR